MIYSNDIMYPIKQFVWVLPIKLRKCLRLIFYFIFNNSTLLNYQDQLNYFILNLRSWRFFCLIPQNVCRAPFAIFRRNRMIILLLRASANRLSSHFLYDYTPASFCLLFSEFVNTLLDLRRDMVEWRKR